jgi:pyruvate/2-oxoglutarate dehydrogenase complex dihydrolipoamide dehydrogenase (E3) component
MKMADKFDYDIGIIGGGAAGLTVASGAAQLGAKTLLIEKEEKLGGDCLHFGCVPSKTLIRTAHVRHMMKNARNYGLPEVDLPPVDFSEVASRIKSVIDTIQKHDSVERFCSLGAEVEFGEAEFQDDHEIMLNGKRVSAKTWVLATGSSPFVPPVQGLESVPFITNKEIFSLDRLPASMAIMGGGPIAIEMAQAFSRLGTKVTVIQRDGQILSREDKDMADTLRGIMASEGVRFILNAEVTKVRDLGDGRELTVKCATKIQSVTAELLMVATGRTPNVSGLRLENTGVDYSLRGIETDARLRTSRKHIYAAGDSTGKYLFTHAAGYEGGIVVSNAIFRLPRKTDYTNLPWCTYSDPELASIGLNESRAVEQGIKYSVWTEKFSANDRSLAEGEREGMVKMLLDEKEKPLGIQVLGPQAGELISEWVAVMNGGVKLTTLAGAIHPYPTLGEINKRVAGSFLTPKIFSKRVRRGLKFFFNLKGRACGENSL